MKVHGKMLNDDHVAAVRVRFEKGMAWGARRTKVKLTFDELLGHFADDSVSFADIARLACEGGVVRERVSQLYNQYFRDLLPEKRSGRARQRHRAMEGYKAVAEEMTMAFPDQGPLAKVAFRARKAGCTVERVLLPSEGSPVMASRLLSINGRCYKVHGLRNVISNGRSSHLNISRSTLGGLAGVVVVQEVKRFPDRIFVVPSRDILAIDESRGNKGKQIFFYVPVKNRSPRKAREPFLDWGKYENAWPSCRKR